ncbi:hypothetical protein T10_8589 [Trichinella papuae]|uniref:Uncharacterized protein n=1 Tax=Trichinella papuae TaxID=268474 RepID=A0A0V1MY27_9BILA|nr:hypothetical protein T10_8589 [Trichinella papuae]
MTRSTKPIKEEQSPFVQLILHLMSLPIYGCVTCMQELLSSYQMKVKIFTRGANKHSEVRKKQQKNRQQVS